MGGRGRERDMCSEGVCGAVEKGSKSQLLASNLGCVGCPEP